jgi:hypothetical protein
MAPAAAMVRSPPAEAEIERLRDRIAELEELITELTAPPNGLRLAGFRPMEAAILGLLLRRNVVSWTQIYAVLYCGRSNPPMGTTIKVLICHIRKNISRHGVSILTSYGRSGDETLYRITAEDKAKLRAALLEASEAA